MIGGLGRGQVRFKLFSLAQVAEVKLVDVDLWFRPALLCAASLFL